MANDNNMQNTSIININFDRCYKIFFGVGSKIHHDFCTIISFKPSIRDNIFVNLVNIN
jgi:hypothetical protein